MKIDLNYVQMQQKKNITWFMIDIKMNNFLI
jgi:hypothetical protein